jgi:hypothetical protein
MAANGMQLLGGVMEYLGTTGSDSDGSMKSITVDVLGIVSWLFFTHKTYLAVRHDRDLGEAQCLGLAR